MIFCSRIYIHLKIYLIPVILIFFNLCMCNNDQPIKDDTVENTSCWEEPRRLDEPVNSEANDGGPSLTEDGLSLYFYSERESGYGETDIWVTRREEIGSPWGEPENLGAPINTPFHENSPSISGDGSILVFGSNITGNFELFETRYSRGRWEEPVHISSIASDMKENKPSLSSDMMTLYFKRNSEEVQPDLYMTEGGFGNWGPAIPLTDINTDEAETDPFISWDGMTLYFSSGRFSTSPYDIYYSKWQENGWGERVLFSEISYTGARDDGFTMSYDSKEIYFASDRPGSMQTDIYVSRCIVDE